MAQWYHFCNSISDIDGIVWLIHIWQTIIIIVVIIIIIIITIIINIYYYYQISKYKISQWWMW